MPKLQTNYKNKRALFLNIFRKIFYIPRLAFSKFKGLNKQKKLLFILIISLALCMTAGAFYYFINNTKRSNESVNVAKCQAIIDETRFYDTLQQYKDKYADLQAEQKTCTKKTELKKNISNEDNEANEIIIMAKYQNELAKAAYMAGDKKKARQYNDEVRNNLKLLTEAQLDKMSQAEQSILFGTIKDIEDDNYYPGGTYYE